jgi:hypothetical protein
MMFENRHFAEVTADPDAQALAERVASD